MKAKHFFLKLIGTIPAFCALCLILLLVRDLKQQAASEAETAAEPVQGSSLTDCSVSFSMPSGFYPEDFSLTISAPVDFTIYYTLDGSTPTASSAVYTEPLLVTDLSGQEKKHGMRTDLNPEGGMVMTNILDKAYIIKAIGINEDGVSTKIMTATYFIGCENKYQDNVVISIVSDPDNFFDSQTGIYVLGDAYKEYVANGGDPMDSSSANYRQTGKEWKRPAHIDYFDADKNYIFSQEVGIRINGNSSRDDSLKSLRLYARKEYDGNALFTFPFFGDKIYSNSVILRRGIFANQFLPSLVYDRNIATQKYLPCVVFLDGEFWGNYYLLERYDTDYMENYYYVDADNVTIIKDGTLFSGSAEVEASYYELLDYIASHDLSLNENYDYICSQIDMDSYIDYYCTQIYLNNYDFSASKNNVFWRSNGIDRANPYADCRWRWCLMDLDLSLSAYGDIENYETNTFTDTEGYPVAIHTNEIMFGSFLDNANFRQQFVTTFLDLENVNFDYNVVCEKMNAVSELIETPDVWKEFFRKRPDYINSYLAETFGLTGTLTDVTLKINDAAAGSIRLNTVTLALTAGSWTGRYYSDYPVTVSALPDDGYQFQYWIVDGVTYPDAELSIPLNGNTVEIAAVFKAE